MKVQPRRGSHQTAKNIYNYRDTNYMQEICEIAYPFDKNN
jgi:hypothetical protein